jgi:RNA polymerase sigma-70 factor (ECF subfamily)
MTDSAPQCAGPVAGEAASVVVPIVLAMEREEPKPPTLVALFESEEAGLLAFAVGVVKRRWVAEELVQDAFLRLHEVWQQVENPRGWLYRSVRNMALNHLRDHRHEAGLEEAGAVASELAGVASQGGPDEELGRMEAIGMVRLLLADLPAEDRDLIRMKYQEDLKYGEISARTGLGVGNVGYKLHHLLKGLADALRHAGIEGSRG